LSSTDLLAVLRRFYPELTQPRMTARDNASERSAERQESSASTADVSPTLSAPADSHVIATQASISEGFGTLAITSEPDAAELYIDGKFLGNTPAMLKLPTGSHAIVLKCAGRNDYARTVEIPKSSKLTLKAVLSPDKP